MMRKRIKSGFAVVASNEAARKLDNEILTSDVIIQQYDNVVNSINEISRIFKNMGYGR